MNRLNSRELLSLWETNLSSSPLDRSHAVLQKFFSGTESSDLFSLSLGERNRHLLEVRRQIFGSEIQSLVSCPECQKTLELPIDTEAFLQPESANFSPQYKLDEKPYFIKFRIPDYNDLSRAIKTEKPEQYLLKCCLLEILKDKTPIAIDALPETISKKVIVAMDKADPLANIQLKMHCPECDHQWGALFDIALYFWSELDSWAKRTLREIHRIARAYGWTEETILSLSATRRRLYLQLAGGA